MMYWKRIVEICSMKQKKLILPLALVALMTASCGNTVVPKANYDALLTKNQELVAENDSLQFELSSLKMYVDYLEEENGELVEELKRGEGQI